MRCPSATRLVATFRDLDRKGANLIRRLAHATDDAGQLARIIERECPATHEYRRRCYHDPLADYATGRAAHGWRVTMAMHAIDRILGTYGVEPLGPVHMYDGPPYSYCNTGDTYAATLVYVRDTDTIRVSSWGDIAERDPRLADKSEE